MTKKTIILGFITTAITFVIAAYGVLWHLTSARIASQLTDRFGSEAYSSGAFKVKRHGFPFNLAFTLQEFSQRTVQLDGQITELTLQHPLTFETKVWSPTKVRANLDNFTLRHSVVNSKNGKQSYRLNIESGWLKLDPQNSTIIMEANNWGLWQADAANATVVGGGIKFEQLITTEEAEFDGTARPNLLDALFSLSLTDLLFIGHDDAAQTPVQELVIQGGVERFPQQLALDPSTPLADLIQARTRDLAAHNSRIFLSNLRLEANGLTSNLSGDFGVDSELRLKGTLTWRANNAARMASLVNPELLSTPTFRVLEALASAAELNITLLIDDGVLSANQIPLATVPPLPKLLLDVIEGATQPSMP